jgi:hypothetical protein
VLRAIGFFHHCGVLLGYLVHMVYGGVHLDHCRGLFARRTGYFRDQSIELRDLSGDHVQRPAGFANEFDTGRHLLA